MSGSVRTNLDTRLTAGMPPDINKKFTEAFLGSDVVVPRLLQILDTELKAVRAARVTDDFSAVAWPYQQAYLNGKEAQLLDLIKLLTPHRS